MHHCQREARSYGGIHRISPILHDLHTGARGQFVNADHNRMIRMNWLRGSGHRKVNSNRKSCQQQQNE
jgi:hypothetical protein